MVYLEAQPLPFENAPETLHERLAEQADEDVKARTERFLALIGKNSKVIQDMDVVKARKTRVATEKWKNLEHDGKNADTVFSRAFEFTIARKVAEWLGERFRTCMAHEFDDLVRNTDVIVAEKDRKTRIDIDVTTATDDVQLRRKVTQIRNAMFENPRPERLEYSFPLFEEEETSVVNDQTAPIIKVLFGQNKSAAEVLVERFGKKEADKNPMAKMVFLYQMKMQLEHYIEYIQKREPRRREELLQECTEKLATIKDIWKSEIQTLENRYAGQGLNPYTEENIIKQINPAGDPSLYTDKRGIVEALKFKVWGGDPFTQKLRIALDRELPLEDTPLRHN